MLLFLNKALILCENEFLPSLQISCLQEKNSNKKIETEQIKKRGVKKRPGEELNKVVIEIRRVDSSEGSATK